MLVNYRLFQSKKKTEKIEKKLKYVKFWSVRYTDLSQNAILKKKKTWQNSNNSEKIQTQTISVTRK